MKLAIIGSRDFNDYDRMSLAIDRYFSDIEYLSDRTCYFFTEIISGGAKGADALGKKLAEKTGVKYTEFPADWDRNGRQAGFIRNRQIIEACDFVCAFWDGKSRGTANSLSIARELKKDTLIIYF